MILYGTMLASGVMAGIVTLIMSLLSCCSSYSMMSPNTIYVMERQHSEQNNPEFVSDVIRKVSPNGVFEKFKAKFESDDNKKHKTSASTL